MLLIHGTETGALEWQSTADEDSFRLSYPAANIRLTRSVERDEAEHEMVRSLSILNDKGRVIEEYSPRGATEDEEFDRVFDHARRSAYKTDQVLDHLMDEIRSQFQTAARR
jgi:hypothetical protein